MSVHSETASALFEHAFKAYPTRAAFTCLGSTLTFKDVDDRSAALAAFFIHGLKLQAGDRIALQLPNICQYPIAIYAAMRAGLVVVNVNPLYSSRELCHQLKDSGAKALIVLANVAHEVSTIIDQTPIEHVIVTEIADSMPWPKRSLVNFVIKHVKKMVPAFSFHKSISFLDALKQGGQLLSQHGATVTETSPDDLMVLQYTGGTTGLAKGAMLTQHNLYSNVVQMKEHMPEFFSADVETFAAPLPLYHIYALNLHVLAGFSNGAHSILIPNPRDLPALFKAFEPFKITVFVGLNTLFNAMMHHPLFDSFDSSSLKVTSAGGMALTSETARLWQERTHCNISEGYGLTETSPIVSSNKIDAIQMGTIGTPLPNTQVRVINEEGVVLPEGEAGELCVKGPQVMKGYWGKPEATAEVLDDEGWFRTGDIAVIQPDGYIKIVDRKKDMIIVSGFNVYPNEVEDVAMTHPEIMEAAVIGVPQASGGEIVKIFVVAENPGLSEEDVISYCRENLTAYKAPKLVEFRKELPKSNVGKILRRELRDNNVT
ncbi:AMP-binding protein [Marinagarivorans algicola]|uniref:AMP-binding protein n=1 Tax=Marinagarivorans algicola TaxID=1513270 RepID=UPI0006B49CD8|nr:AMP-binding protein [Marinagarivorans algicola]